MLNRGFSGYNTKMGLDLLPSIFPPTAKVKSSGGSGILFATVFFGANDASLPGERQHVPLEEYGKNLEKIIAGIRYVSNSRHYCVFDGDFNLIFSGCACLIYCEGDHPPVLATKTSCLLYSLHHLPSMLQLGGISVN